MNIRKALQEAYLDWVNNYLTVEKYAEHNLLTVDNALKVIEAGREAHEAIVEQSHDY